MSECEYWQGSSLWFGSVAPACLAPTTAVKPFRHRCMLPGALACFQLRQMTPLRIANHRCIDYHTLTQHRLSP